MRVAASAGFERRAAHHHPRRSFRGFERRGQRRDRGGAEAEQHALGERHRLERHVVDRQGEVEVVDRARHEPQQPLRHGEPEPEAGDGAGDADHGRLAHHEPEHLVPAHPERAQRADQRPALHDRERHRLVDEKHADDQREQRERRQVPLERQDHSPGDAGLRARGHEVGAAGERVGDARQELRIVDDQVDGGEQFLGRRNVGHHQLLERASTGGIGGLEQADDGQRPTVAADVDGQDTPRRQAQLMRGGRRDQGGSAPPDQVAGAGEQITAAGLPPVLGAEIRPELRIDERIDAEDVQRPSRAARHRDVAFHDRRGVTHAELQPQAAIEIVGKSGRPAQDLMRRPAADGFRRQPERAQRAAVRQVDRHRDRDAERDANDREHELPGMREELPPRQASELTRQHVVRSTSPPRSMAKMRSATPMTSRL